MQQALALIPTIKINKVKEKILNFEQEEPPFKSLARRKHLQPT
jgi:hypothetical protein